MLPTISELEDCAVKRFVFPRNNAVRYWMDFASWEGLPSDLIFYLDGNASYDRVVLRAKGYGVREDYGNGSIFISPKYLPAPL